MISILVVIGHLWGLTRKKTCMYVYFQQFTFFHVAVSLKGGPFALSSTVSLLQNSSDSFFLPFGNPLTISGCSFIRLTRMSLCVCDFRILLIKQTRQRMHFKITIHPINILIPTCWSSVLFYIPLSKRIRVHETINIFHCRKEFVKMKTHQLVGYFSVSPLLWMLKSVTNYPTC